METGFISVEGKRVGECQMEVIFYNLISEVTPIALVILFIRSKSLCLACPSEEGTTQGCEHWEVESVQPSQKLPSTD